MCGRSTSVFWTDRILEGSNGGVLRWMHSSSGVWVVLGFFLFSV